ncbi:hypothetical protein HDU85_001846 [Gaertneriomyces sp. JEL0708]|nr:hypothetical protein HDU85_001846 [Gaertneriomyces sp. JEL0708]
MHERNPYKTPPDFELLAVKHPSLQPYIRKTKYGKGTLDFKNRKALRELTYALLWVDFQLRVEFPLDSLCPPVPNRLDYVLLIEDLVKKGATATATDQIPTIRGIDIGTGASCIYPLLACQRNETWSMLALDIDERNIAYATSNVERNKLQKRIVVKMNHPSKILSTKILGKELSYDFCMCNPPFYASEEQMKMSSEGKEKPPFAICTGSSTEMVTPGGEIAFILRVVKESTKPRMRERIRWFTSLIGRKEDVTVVTAELEGNGSEYHVFTLQQAKTVRWVIAWTFTVCHERESANLMDLGGQ